MFGLFTMIKLLILHIYLNCTRKILTTHTEETKTRQEEDIQ